MRKEFLVERQGKQFVLYSGLLAMAHEQGLSSVTTELVQIPSEANNRVAICTARITLEKDGKVVQFTGIGDAAPNNVAPGDGELPHQVSGDQSEGAGLAGRRECRHGRAGGGYGRGGRNPRARI